MEDPVLCVSPFKTLFSGIEPHYAWYYEGVDMVRRLALTCGGLLFTNLNSLVLFSLTIALLALLGHTQVRSQSVQSVSPLGSGGSEGTGG